MDIYDNNQRRKEEIGVYRCAAYQCTREATVKFIAVMLCSEHFETVRKFGNSYPYDTLPRTDRSHCAHEWVSNKQWWTSQGHRARRVCQKCGMEQERHFLWWREVKKEHRI